MGAFDMKLPWRETEAGKQWLRAYKNRWKKENRKKNLEKARAYGRKRYHDRDKAIYRTIRETVLNHYGGQCACCGESVYEFLAMDHIFGGGNKHRKARKKDTLAMWLYENGYPEGFQVLCHNCNMAKGFYGRCPHGSTISKLFKSAMAIDK